MRSSGTTRIDGHSSDKTGSGKTRPSNKAASGSSAGRTGSRGRPEPVRLLPTAEELASRVGWRESIDVTVAGLGYELVDVEREQRGLLRVTIDRVPDHVYPVATDSTFVTVEDCEQVTRQLQYVLQVEGLDYARLEVSSPGLDRLLRNDADLRRFEGQAVSIALKLPFEGRKGWKGVLGRAGASVDQGTAAPLAQPADASTSHEDAAWQLVFDDRGIERVLGFQMHEVREARLVPVVDFKGRRSTPRETDSPGVPEPEGESAGGRGDAAVDSGVDGS